MNGSTQQHGGARSKPWLGAAAALAFAVTACGGGTETEGAIGLEQVADDFDRPVFLTHADDGSGRLFVVEQEGRILTLDGRTTFLDLTDQVRCCGERGLLGLAFHPDFPDDPRFFVNYTRSEDGATVIAEFQTDAGGTTAAPGSERILLTIPQPYGNHNGGMVAFGPDGFLYIGTGDGGSGGDPLNLGQNRNELLGKMLRIDVDGARPYAIPGDNPFVEGGGEPEIFAIGLRNPWRFSFDRETGDLWAGDVGQNAVEEVSVVTLGGNYGWRLKEGSRDYEPNGTAGPLVDPVVEYAHERGRCSITGGYVYRGSALPELTGSYVYGDYCSGEVFASRGGVQQILLDTSLAIASFGEDQDGELYLLDLGGEIHRLVPRAPGDS